MKLKSEMYNRLSELHSILGFVLLHDSDSSIREADFSSLMVRLYKVYTLLWCRSSKSFLKR